MTHGEIYETAYRLKAFQVWELVEELLKNWDFLGRRFVKDRVNSWLALQVRHQAVVKVHSDPPIFALKEFSDCWQSHLRHRTCPVCKKSFLPQKSQTVYCSQKCADKEYAKRKWKKLKARRRKPKRWNRQDTELLKKIIREKGKLTTQDFRELAKLLGRTFKSVQHKYYDEVRKGAAQKHT